MLDICSQFDKPYDPNPLKDIAAEQQKGRTYRIVPADNGTGSDIDAVIKGTTQSANDFLKVARQADALYSHVDSNGRLLFNDNLRQPSYYLYYLNKSLLHLCKAYQMKEDVVSRNKLLNQSITDLKNAEKSLKHTQHGCFAQWYAGDRIFGFEGLYKLLNSLTENEKPV